MEDQTPGANEERGSKSGSKKWFLIAAGLIVMLGGAAAAVYFFGFSAEAEEVAEETPVVELNQVNDVFELEPLVVNLADGEEIRYARIGISLGLASAKPGEPIIDDKLLIPKVRDRLLVLVAEKTAAELGAPEVKEALKKAIADFMNANLDQGQGRVKEVYFTEFIVQ